MTLAKRQQIARENVQRMLKVEGVDWVEEIQRTDAGYTVTFRKGPKEFVRRGIDEAVLEDDAHPLLEHLIAEARQELEKQ